MRNESLDLNGVDITSCSASFPRSATRCRHCQDRRLPVPGHRRRCAAQPASAPPASRPSTSAHRRSHPAGGRTSCSPAVSSRCPACRWILTAAPGQPGETNYDTYFIPQGVGADLIATIEGFTRDDVDAYAARSQERVPAAQARPVQELIDPSQGHQRPGPARQTTSSSARARPSRRSQVRNPRPSLRWARMGGFDAVAPQKYHWVEKIDHVHTPATAPASWTALASS